MSTQSSAGEFGPAESQYGITKCGRCGKMLTQTASIIAGRGRDGAGMVTRRNVHGATTTSVVPGLGMEVIVTFEGGDQTQQDQYA